MICECALNQAESNFPKAGCPYGLSIDDKIRMLEQELIDMPEDAREIKKIIVELKSQQ